MVAPTGSPPVPDGECTARAHGQHPEQQVGPQGSRGQVLGSQLILRETLCTKLCGSGFYVIVRGKNDVSFRGPLCGSNETGSKL